MPGTRGQCIEYPVMRIRQALLSCAVSISLSISLAPPAVAQSFFQKLFGLGGGQQVPQAPARPQTRTIPSHRFEYSPRPYHQSRPDDADGEIGPPDSGGPYRTMCVRSCDGYFFPLRHNAKRRNFAADAKSCRSACGTEARLFYYSLNGGSTESMADLSGRKYKDQPHAFLYRKALKQGCACKPVPWAYEEAARHRQYEESDAVAIADKSGAASKETELPGNAGSTSVSKFAAATGTTETPTLPDDPGLPAHDQNSETALTKEGAAATDVPKPAETSEPIGIKAEKAGLRRGKFRDTRVGVKKSTFQPAYQPTSGSSFFGPSKSKYRWPGD